MTRRVSVGVFVLVLAMAVAAASPGAQRRQGDSGSPADDSPRRGQPRREEPASGRDSERRAEPRPDDDRRAEPQRTARPPALQNGAPRRPPPRTEPPQLRRPPRPHAFAPLSVVRAYYYHPYFGFYYGPYYGPFYPPAGSVASPARYSASALRLRVKPVETEVFVNGYYAGIVDDFDGMLRRLYLPAGPHTIELQLAGHETFTAHMYLTAGDRREITHQMRPLNPGARAVAPRDPQPVPEEWTFAGEVPPPGDPPASPFGILTLRTDPSDVQIVIDDEVWLGDGGPTELVVHLAEGWHRLEVRKPGLRTFTADVQLSAGSTTRLQLRLTP